MIAKLKWPSTSAILKNKLSHTREKVSRFSERAVRMAFRRMYCFKVLLEPVYNPKYSIRGDWVFNGGIKLAMIRG